MRNPSSLGAIRAVTFDDFLKQACPPLDLQWRKYRRRAARHGVSARMAELRLGDYEQYLDRLHRDPEEAESLPTHMRITVTRFFRESQRWEVLGEKVLPELLERTPDAPVKAWCVGCCGGEEPYTLALLWLSELQQSYPGRRLEILATDIDNASLKRAQLALYTRGCLREVPPKILQKWFRQQGGLQGLDDRLRQRIAFRRHDFMADPPPKHCDLVLARYLPFTYYRGERLHLAARRLWQALRPGGALMIGRKETLGAEAEGFFTPWPQAAGIYRATSDRTPEGDRGCSGPAAGLYCRPINTEGEQI